MADGADLWPFLERVVLPPGWRIHYQAQVGSTQDLARRADEDGLPSRSVFVADYQTVGRGRRSRRWASPPGAGLLFTALLRHRGWAPQVLTMLGSVALSEAVEGLVGISPGIKWPNDLYIGPRKLAGILAEGRSEGDRHSVFLGIGVNVNTPDATLDALPSATSLSREAGWHIHRGELLVLILEAMDRWLAELESGDDGALWEAWNDRLWGRHQRVMLRDGDVETPCTVLEAERDGSLVVLTASGERRRVLAGELLI